MLTVLINALCFIMGHSIGPINTCTNFKINRYKIDAFRKHAHAHAHTGKINSFANPFA